MTKGDFLDEPPSGVALTAYDKAYIKVYLRLLDADAQGADWKEVVEVLFGLDARAETDRAFRVYTAHLKRAKWIRDNGFRELSDRQQH